MTILEYCEWLESTWPAQLARDSLYGFQILVALHLLGLVFSVGALLWFELRLLGMVMPRSRLSELYRGLAPFFAAGFVVMFASGAMLLAGFATAAYGNIFFRIKLAALALAGANAVIYHYAARRTIAEWDDAARLPRHMRLAGLASIVLWTIVILMGRMMSYTMF